MNLSNITKKEGRFRNTPVWNQAWVILSVGIFCWSGFGGYVFFEKFMKNGSILVSLPVSIFVVVSWYVGMFVTLGLILRLIFTPLEFIFGSRKKELIGTVSPQESKNPVDEYIQQTTRTTLSQLSPSSDKRVSPATSVPIANILPPESFFSVPRKIDWDTLNKTRKHHGDLGEMFVCDLEKNYLTKIGRSDLAEKVHHVASEGDGQGYDIQSFNKDGSKKFIEVKATNSSTGSSFNISKNEFNFLQNNLSSAVVYHVHNVNNERETTVVVYPADEVLNSPNISPSGYIVKM